MQQDDLVEELVGLRGGLQQRGHVITLQPLMAHMALSEPKMDEVTAASRPVDTSSSANRRALDTTISPRVNSLLLASSPDTPRIWVGADDHVAAGVEAQQLHQHGRALVVELQELLGGPQVAARRAHRSSRRRT